MDMDMDIPLPEELEWLETNALLEEEEGEFYPEEDQNEKLLSPPERTPSGTSTFAYPTESSALADQSAVSENQINAKKRHWLEKEISEALSSGMASSDEKRNRVTPSGTKADEDWLRYSPPRENTDVAPTIVEEETFLSRFASEIDGDCIPVTGPDGDRVYAKVIRAERNDVLNKLSTQGQTSDLISEPISILMQSVEQEAFMKALQASSESPSDLILPDTPVVNEQLWVDKYAPNSFTELLSDEQTNREVLLWLKQWDSLVFGSEIRSTTDDVLSALRRHSSLAQHQKLSDLNSLGKHRGSPLSYRASRHSNNLNGDNKNLKSIQELLNRKSRGTGPPEQKVLLLCGPPGLGKTTLAHIAAKHSGYRVVEINASDDRSSTTIEAKIIDAVQMNSVMADSKPKCLVIDEIDGALGEGKGAVEVILKMISADQKFEVGKRNVYQEEKTGKISSKKGRKSTPLLRPVICICNDLFAPALRPLHQVAKVHVFSQPTISRVVSRLKYICNKEGFRTSSIALTALAEYTECDIRSCLNTLQFLNRKEETLNMLEVSSQVVGRKDISRSVFDVWKEVFQKKKTRREKKAINSCSTKSSDFDTLHSLISNRGDYELTMDGIHENILQLHYHDPTMRKTVKCLNILGISDFMHRYIMRNQQMSLLVYQPSTATAIHHLIAQVEKPNIEWPKSFHRYQTMLMEKKELLRFWYNKISASISRHLSVESFVEDNISPLLHILSPPTLRPVALHLLSEKEKDDLAQLVDTMVSYSITYKNLKPELLPNTLRREEALDASALFLDPPIVDFIDFKDYSSCHFGLSLAVKQVLVHEVEKQKILRESNAKSVFLNDRSNGEEHAMPREESSRPLSAKTDIITSYSEQNVEYSKDKSVVRQCGANASINLSTSGSNTSASTSGKVKAPGGTKKPSGGFFDRFRKLSSKGSQNSETTLPKPATLERDSRPLLFKFNEGFTNAIKRPVRVRELLL